MYGQFHSVTSRRAGLSDDDDQHQQRVRPQRGWQREIARRLRRTRAADRERGQPLRLYPRQYSGLQQLQDRFGDQGLSVLGFPCNDFGGQEPGSLPEIQSFCSTTYGASFELFGKVHAMGSTTEPFTTLNRMEPAGDVGWNFEKFLVGKDGTVIERFKSGVEPEQLSEAIQAALDA